jgi:hypothetical protein
MFTGSARVPVRQPPERPAGNPVRRDAEHHTRDTSWCSASKVLELGGRFRAEEEQILRNLELYFFVDQGSLGGCAKQATNNPRSDKESGAVAFASRSAGAP